MSTEDMIDRSERELDAARTELHGTRQEKQGLEDAFRLFLAEVQVTMAVADSLTKHMLMGSIKDAQGSLRTLGVLRAPLPPVELR